MRIRILPSTLGEIGTGQRSVRGLQYLTSFLVNEEVVIDAGSIGFFAHPEVQAKVEHIFITHSHIDHVASLPLFLENAFRDRRECVTVYGSDAVLESLQQDLFNDRVWPDFIRISKGTCEFLRRQELRAERARSVQCLRRHHPPWRRSSSTSHAALTDVHRT